MDGSSIVAKVASPKQCMMEVAYSDDKGCVILEGACHIF